MARGHKETSGIARDAAQEQPRHVREATPECCTQAQDKVRGAKDAFDQCVREQPLASVAIAAGVGLLVGRIGMRR